MKSTVVLPLLFLGVASHPSMVMAQSPGTFTATGNLNTERLSHTATLLTNGKVLIAGGFAYPFSYPARASAELYDPFTWTCGGRAEPTLIPATNATTIAPTHRHIRALFDDMKFPP